MDETSGISRRDAIKKAAVAGGVAGVVWSAPKVHGLSLRPNYASASSHSIISSGWTFSGGASTSVEFTGLATLDTPLAGVNQVVFNARPFANGSRARVVVTGDTLVTRSCFVTITDAGSFNLTAATNNLSQRNESELRFTNSFAQFTANVPAKARGNITCNSA